MKNFLLFFLFLSFVKINAQSIDSCSTRIFINKYGDNWNLEIDTPIYNQPFQIRNQYGLFKLKIDTCLGKIDLSLYLKDTLLEQGSFQIYNKMNVDSHFVEDSFGDLQLAPFHHFSAYKIGNWKYWSPKDYYIKNYPKK